MKILMANHFPLQGSGSGIYTLNIARGLVKLGHEVTVITPDVEKSTDDLLNIDVIMFNSCNNSDSELDFNFPCFTTHPKSNQTFYDLSEQQIEQYIDAWKRHFEKQIELIKPDIIHAHHVWVTPYVASLYDIPFVTTCHGTDLIGYKKDSRYEKIAMEGALKSQKIIAISKQIQGDAIKTYKKSEEDTPVIGNGFNVEYFDIIEGVTKKDALPECNISDETVPVISFVGKFTQLKGIDTLLKAAQIYEKELGEVKTVLAGNGELMDEMVALSKELGLKGVHFVGHKNHTQLAKIFNVASVSVVPSRIEGFGLVAIEALACGTPVVASKVGGLPEFISDEVGQLVEVDNPEALAKAIIEEIKNNTKETKGKYAHDFALKNYTWKQQVKKVENLYNSIL